MEINKQLFEDVLSGKLKGTFVLRNGFMCSGKQLCRSNGAFGFTNGDSWDIVDFIPDTDMKENMKENELTIEIPNGKIVDWDESKKQNKVVLKDKQLTYEDVCKKLFEKRMYFIDKCGTICLYGPANVTDPNNAPTEHQLECILAKNKLANVAKYLNDGWKPEQRDYVYGLVLDRGSKDVLIPPYMWNTKNCSAPMFVFKSKELVQQAIEILGEETVKLALEPLGI